LFAPLELHKIRLLVPQLRVLTAVTVTAQARFTSNHFRAELA
jgi:hypothetical protein